MPGRLTQLLLLLFLGSLGLNWPHLPGNAQFSDVLFLPLVLALAIEGARPAFRPIDSVVLAYLLGVVPSLLVSPDPAGGLIELVRHIYLVAIYFTITMAVRRGYLADVATGLAWSGTGLAVAGVIFVTARLFIAFDAPAAGSIMALPYVGPVLRLRAFTASESMLACVLAMAAPFAVAKWATTRHRGWLAATLAMLVAAAFTFSHSFAGVSVAVVIVAWPWLPGRQWRYAAAAAAMVIVIGFNLAAAVSLRSVDTGGTAFADATDYHYGVDTGGVSVGDVTITYQVMSYLRLKQVALDAWLAHPVAGVGLDRFHDVTTQAFQAGRLTSLYREVDPHSTLPGRLAETGLVGGLTLLALWIAFARRSVAFARRSVAALAHAGPEAWFARAAVAGLGGILVNSINADVMNYRFVWVALGIIAGLATRDDR